MSSSFQRPLVFATLLGASALSLAAAEFTARVNAFQSGDVASLSSDLAFRFAALVGVADEANQATHVLLQGLSPLAPSSAVHSSPYSAINLATGVEQDAGMVFMNITNGNVPAGAVSSPVVGVLQRTASWSSVNPQTPSTTVGGGAGTSAYDTAGGTISFSLTRGGQTFTGSTAYTVYDVDTIGLNPFALTSGAETFNFHETMLARDGLRFYGVLESADLTVGYDSLLHVIEFVDLPDVDGDGLPDISDPDVGLPGDCPADGWVYHLVLTWVYNEVGCWGLWAANLNPNWGWVYRALLDDVNGGWMYSAVRGWVYIFPNPSLDPENPVFFVYDLSLGWLTVLELEGVIYYNVSGTEIWGLWNS